MQEDVEKTVGHKFKLGHLIMTDTRKASQDSVIMHCDTDHDGRVGVQFMSPGGWRELSIGMGFIDRREGRRGYTMMDGTRTPSDDDMERVRFTHEQSHWAMSGMLAGCEDMPNPGPNGEETYVHIAKCGCDRPTRGWRGWWWGAGAAGRHHSDKLGGPCDAQRRHRVLARAAREPTARAEPRGPATDQLRAGRGGAV